MSKRIRRSVRKLIAKTLVLSLLFSFVPKTAEACDAAVAEAVMETAKEVSVVCPPAGPIIVGTAAIIVTGVTIYGKCVNNKANELDIYFTLGHLPDYWKPHSVMDKINPGGKIIQRRIYDAKGRPLKDIDLSHHGTPKYHPWTKDGKYIHVHDHVYGKNITKNRRSGREITNEEYKKYVEDVNKIDINKRYRMRVEHKDEQNFTKQSK